MYNLLAIHLGMVLCILLSDFTYDKNNIDSICPVKHYFDKINEAELNLLNENHKISLRLYDEAFKSGEKGRKTIFIKDIHNALMLAYQNGNIQHFKNFIDHLYQYDVDSSFFETVGYEELKESNFYPIVRSFFGSKEQRHFNSPVCSVFNRLFMLDQSIRKACNDFFSGSYYHFCGKEIALLDSLVLLQLTDYFYKNGVPKESEFCSVSKYFTPPYRLIMLHNFQWCRLELIDFIKGKTGRIHPQVLADLLHFTYNEPCDGSDRKDHLGLSYQFRLGDSLYIIPPPEERVDSINKNRREFNLDNLEDFHRKIKFQEFNPEYILVYGFLTPQIAADGPVLEALKKRFKDNKVNDEK